MTIEIDEAGMVRQMLEDEARSSGLEFAFESVGRAIGASRWTAWGIWHGRRKSFGGTLSSKIRQAYLAFCRRQLAKAEAQLRLAELGCGDDHFTDFRSEIEDLARRMLEADRRA